MSNALSFPTGRITSGDQLENVVESSQALTTYVAENSRNFQTVDVTETMRNLSMVGRFLQLASAGCRNQPSWEKTVDLERKYQILLTDALGVNSKFLSTACKACELYSEALQLVNEGELDYAMEEINECVKLAKMMENESQSLADRADEMIQLTGKSMDAVMDDDTKAKKKQEENEQSRIEKQAKNDVLKEKATTLEVDKKEAESKLKTAEEEKKNAGFLTFAAQTTSILLKPISEPLIAMSTFFTKKNDTDTTAQTDFEKAHEALAESMKKLARKEEEIKQEEDPQKKSELELEKAELASEVKSNKKLVKNHKSALAGVRKIMQERERLAQDEVKQREIEVNEIKDELRSINSSLILNLGELKGLQIEKTYLDKTRQFLEITDQSLRIIQVIFTNVTQFWVDRKNQCLELADTRRIKRYANEPDALAEKIKLSGCNWITFGIIIYNSLKALDSVKRENDRIFTNPIKESEFHELSHRAEKLESEVKENQKRLDQQ